MRIGFLDSGAGGLTTMCQTVEILGGGDYVYLADTANAPYGNKSLDELIRIGAKAIERLKGFGCECVVIGCNTMTACAKRELEKKFRDIVLVGTEPALKPAIGECLRVALLATPATIGSERCRELISSCRGQVTSYPQTSLAGIIEEIVPDTSLLDGYALKNLSFLKKYDAVVLGCTHFVYLRPYIEKHYPHVKIFDGNLGVASRVKALIGKQKAPSKYVFLDTSDKNGEKHQKIFFDLQKKFKKGIEK